MKLNTKNILDMLKDDDEIRVREYLQTFYCPVNPTIENFVRNRSIDFARRKISITYTVNDLDDARYSASLPSRIKLY